MQSREAGDVSSFAEMLDNIFSPLFAVSIDPSCDPALHYFLGAHFTKLHHTFSLPLFFLTSYWEKTSFLFLPLHSISFLDCINSSSFYLPTLLACLSSIQMFFIFLSCFFNFSSPLHHLVSFFLFNFFLPYLIQRPLLV